MGNTMTMTQVFEIVPHISGDYTIMRNGEVLRDRNGNVRYFRTRNSARKRISRERLGNFSR